MTRWAERTPSVKGLVLYGSRGRIGTDIVSRADDLSDWDFQVISSHPSMFADRSWTSELVGLDLHAYSTRAAILGGVPKVNALFAQAEVDFIIIPVRAMRILRLFAALGRHRLEGRTRRRLQDLAYVMRPGFRFLKGGRKWDRFYRQIVADLPDAPLRDGLVRQLAEGFVCDYVWALRRIARGELRAAQRMLYRELYEVNLCLLHELKRRNGEQTFPMARRIERVASQAELEIATFEGPIDVEPLRIAVEKSASAFRELARKLVGDTWRWPEVK